MPTGSPGASTAATDRQFKSCSVGWVWLLALGALSGPALAARCPANEGRKGPRMTTGHLGAGTARPGPHGATGRGLGPCRRRPEGLEQPSLGGWSMAGAVGPRVRGGRRPPDRNRGPAPGAMFVPDHSWARPILHHGPPCLLLPKCTTAAPASWLRSGIPDRPWPSPGQQLGASPGQQFGP